MSKDIKELSLDLYEPKDISEAFTLICLRLGLDIKKEESVCFKNKNGKVDFNILVNLANRYDLKVTLDFKIHTMDIEYTPLVDDVRTLEEVLEEEEERKKKLSSAMLENMAKSKKGAKVEVKENDIIEEPKDDGLITMDDLEDDLDFLDEEE